MIATEEMMTVSFKEVHAQLKKEGDFLLQSHDVSGFMEKGTFLKDCGFSNSIASRLYIDTATKSEFIKRMYDKYKGLYRFLLEPQLERLCEKYNLYVRKLDYFIGDIPSKNVQDIMKFKLYEEDLMERDHIISMFVAEKMKGVSGISGQSMFANIMDFNNIKTTYDHNMAMWHDHVGKMLDMAKINELSSYTTTPLIEIAAVKSMFDEKAFDESGEWHNLQFRTQSSHPTKRILQYRKQTIPEAPARSRVDLDPIVLVNLDGCRLIVTAWGDEANDELVANPTNN